MRFLRWLIPALVMMALVPAQSADAIVAGAPVAITDHPYQVRVVMRAPSGRSYSCGGVVYDATHVVTAAHCMYLEDTLLAPGKVGVGYGHANRRNLVAASVAEVTIPGAYLDDASYDVASLTLAAPLTFTPSVRSIPLASAATLGSGVGAEANAFATGWGNTTYAGSSEDVLRGVPLPLRADAICAANVHYAAITWVPGALAPAAKPRVRTHLTRARGTAVARSRWTAGADTSSWL